MDEACISGNITACPKVIEMWEGKKSPPPPTAIGVPQKAGRISYVLSNIFTCMLYLCCQLRIMLVLAPRFMYELV